MPTKRRQLPLTFHHPEDLDHVIALAENAAEYEFYGDRDSYAGCVHEANTRLNRSERCFFAGFLAARRSELP
jgi:hypothetical protein